MRVLQLTDKHAGQGGLGRHVNVLRERLLARGFEVTTVHATNGPATAGERLPVSYGPVSARRAWRTLDALLLRLAPDVVHLHAGYTTLGARLLQGVRGRHACVGTLHDVRPFCFQGDRWFRPAAAPCQRRCGAGCVLSGCVTAPPGPSPLRALRMWAVEARARAAWAALDAVVTPSQFVRDLALAHGFSRERTHVVRHFVELPPPAAPAMRMGHGIACVGSLLPKKGVDLLLRALALVRRTDWSARIVGDGPERPALEAMCRTLGLQDRVTFLGTCAPARRDEVLAAARLVVMPSLLPESLGLAGLEALAMARPVIGFGLGGTAEWLLHERTGLVAAPAGPAVLAAAIDRLLDEPQLAERLGQQGRALVAERFGADQTLDRLVDLYQRVQAARTGRTA